MPQLQYKLSLCIPTYNRAKHLVNCLQSIFSIDPVYRNQIEICISNNGSSDNTEEVVHSFQEKMPIVYCKNPINIGIPRNFLNVVSMASGEFAWLLGDDDLLLPETVQRVISLIVSNPDVDFFFANSFHLTTEYVMSFPQPFNTVNLPSGMLPFSNYTKTGKLPFLALIDPAVSFDFLGGMFLAIFRREMWEQHANKLDKDAIHDMRTFSHFDNTFPHVKIFANAFCKSIAYFEAKPLSVCLTGAREWSPMYPLIHSVRMVEALEVYRKNGLGLIKYLYCRNFALNNFVSDVGAMIVHRKVSGYQYVNFLKLFFKNSLYPNTYLSFFYFAARKIAASFRRKADN